MRPVLEDNLRLAWSEANKYYQRFRWKWKLSNVDPEDMRQEAVIALMDACEKFNPDHPRANWPNYAALSIRRRLQKWLRKAGGNVRLPVLSSSPRTYERTGTREIADARVPSAPDSGMQDAAVAALGCLRREDREIVQQYFGIGCEARKQADIARFFGVSRQRINQRIVTAQKQLRKILKAKGIGNG